MKVVIIDLVANAYISKGMINFNASKFDSAIDNFLFVLNNYQKTKYFKEALQHCSLFILQWGYRGIFVAH